MANEKKAGPRPAAKPATSTKAVPRIFARDGIEHRIDTFKVTVAEMIKNTSWDKKVFQPEDIEHCHIYHSHSERGEPQKYTTATGGHFHEVTLVYDAASDIESIECGPPLLYREKQSSAGIRKNVRPVEWTVIDPNTGDQVVRTDTHTHDFKYLGSELFSNHKKKEIQEMNAKGIGPVQTKPGKAESAVTADLAGALEEVARD